jgi:pantoate--beta-alanine ligase
MITVAELGDLHSQVSRWRAVGGVGFVPTMGNLHAGHLSLVREARQHADRVIVSIFVNPMQFGGGEDFDSYPRTLERDAAMLEDEGADLLFAPSANTIYPIPQDQQTRVEVPGLSDIFCGASRPGHFVGVATVVCKLLNMVRPDVAVFGKKDFQQLMVIRRMVEDLAMPVQIMGVDTLREADGLAMSSRNGYLTESERQVAPSLYQVLTELRDALVNGDRDFAGLERQGSERLNERGLKTDYLAIRRAEDLALPEVADRELVVLAAAYLGKARLIDNLEVSL